MVAHTLLEGRSVLPNGRPFVRIRRWPGARPGHRGYNSPLLVLDQLRNNAWASSREH